MTTCDANGDEADICEREAPSGDVRQIHIMVVDACELAIAQKLNKFESWETRTAMCGRVRVTSAARKKHH